MEFVTIVLQPMIFFFFFYRFQMTGIFAGNQFPEFRVFPVTFNSQTPDLCECISANLLSSQNKVHLQYFVHLLKQEQTFNLRFKGNMLENNNEGESLTISTTLCYYSII